MNMMTTTTPIALDQLWQQLRSEAGICKDPIMAALLEVNLRAHVGFAPALAALLGRKLADSVVPAQALADLATEAHLADPDLVDAAASDLVAIMERDPACPDLITPFLFFKGFQALQAYRVAHWLWVRGRRHLARHLQSRTSEAFGLDIHPAARLGRGIVIYHGTGFVIGLTWFL